MDDRKSAAPGPAVLSKACEPPDTMGWTPWAGGVCWRTVMQPAGPH